MQVTFEEVSRLCFVVFSPAVSVCVAVFLFPSISTKQRWKTFISFILCIFEYILKWDLLSEEFGTEAGGGFLSVLPHSWEREEESLTCFSSS